MLKGTSWRRAALLLRYKGYTCISDELACRNIATSRYLLCERQNKHPQKYEQTIADALDAFNSTSDSMQRKWFTEMSNTDDLGAESTKYEEKMMEALGAFRDNSASLHTFESLHEKYESTVGTATDAMNTENADYEQTFRVALDAFNSNLNYSASPVLLLETNKFPETNSLSVNEFELQKALRSVVKATQFSLSVQAFEPRKQNESKRFFEGSFRLLNSKLYTSPDTFLEGKERTKCGRVLSKFKKKRARPDEILQKMLSVEEKNVLRQMIRKEVNKQLEMHEFYSKGDSKHEKHDEKDSERDGKRQEKIDELSHVILENLMAQMLKNAIIKQKLMRLIGWIKRKENQRKVMKNILWFIVFIIRFKFIVIHALPEAMGVLTSVDMFSSFKLDNDLKAIITTSCFVDLGKLTDGKSVSITSTTSFTVDESCGTRHHNGQQVQ